MVSTDQREAARCGGGAPGKAGRAELGGKAKGWWLIYGCLQGRTGDMDRMLPAEGSATRQAQPCRLGHGCVAELEGAAQLWGQREPWIQRPLRRVQCSSSSHEGMG